jgi:hypothetical protein
MDPNTSIKDLLAEMEAIDKALVEQKQELLDTEVAYSNRGRKLEDAVESYLHNYSDPKNQRARTIQETSVKLTYEIKSFTGRRIDILNGIAFLLMQLNLTAASLMTEAIPWLTAEPSKASEPLDIVRSFQVDMDRMQARLVLLAARAIIAGTMVLSALQVAINLIRLRQGKLESYLGETLSINIDAALDAVQDVAAAVIREETYKALLETSAQVLGVAVESVFPLVKLATIAHDLYSKLAALKKRYGREEVDDMLDFFDQIQNENDAIRKTVELFDAVREGLARTV